MIESSAVKKNTGKVIERKPLWHQWQVLSDKTTPLQISISGLGGGKSWTGADFAISRSTDNHSKVPFLCVGPTNMFLQRTTMPSLERAFTEMGIRYKWRDKIQGYVHGPQGREIWLQSAHNPESAKGPNCGGLWLDEPGVVKRAAYEAAASRCRDDRVPFIQQLLTGTHEGLGWLYKLCLEKDDFGAAVAKVIQSTTLDNPHLSEGFVKRLLALFPDPAKRRMYVYGIATALMGSIYTQFRQSHILPWVTPRAGEVLTCWDFNVNWMVTLLGAHYPGITTGTRLHFWKEMVTKGGTTVPLHAKRVADFLISQGVAMYSEVQLRGRWRRMLVATNGSGPVVAVIDASGKNPHSTSPETAQVQVENAGFLVRHNESNPYVGDRIATVQHWLTKNWVAFDPRGCPMAIRAFMEHQYRPNSDPPEPQKIWKGDDDQLDHYTDAGGYAMCWVEPIELRSNYLYAT